MIFCFQKSLLNQKTVLLYVYAVNCWQNVLTAIVQNVSRYSLASTLQFSLYQYNLCVRFHFSASMASSETKAKTESDVTQAGEESLKFDENSSRTMQHVKLKQRCSLFLCLQEINLLIKLLYVNAILLAKRFGQCLAAYKLKIKS